MVGSLLLGEILVGSDQPEALSSWGLEVAQPALSQQIRKLERQRGLELFERDNCEHVTDFFLFQPVGFQNLGYGLRPAA